MYFVGNRCVRKLMAVIFDLDGVICNSSQFHYLAWKEIADELNIPFDEEYNEKLKGVSRQESFELILSRVGKQNDFTNEEKEKYCTRKNEIYKNYISNMTSEDVLPGVLEFIKEVRLRGIKTGLASVSKNAPFLIKKLELQEYFDYVCNPEEIKNLKPDPEIFLKVAEALDVPPTCCAAIEDSFSGIEAINAADMFSVGVGDAQVLNKARLVLPCTMQLRLSTIADAANFSI